MTLEESTIFVNLKKLRCQLHAAQFCMTKGDRVVYGVPLREYCGKAIAAFVLAFTVKSKRIAYLEECIGYFTVLRIDLEFCAEQNILKYPKRANKLDKDGHPIPWTNDEDKVSTAKVELFRLVGAIDGDMCKWRQSLARQERTCQE